MYLWHLPSVLRANPIITIGKLRFKLSIMTADGRGLFMAQRSDDFVSPRREEDLATSWIACVNLKSVDCADLIRLRTGVRCEGLWT